MRAGWVGGCQVGSAVYRVVRGGLRVGLVAVVAVTRISIRWSSGWSRWSRWARRRWPNAVAVVRPAVGVHGWGWRRWIDRCSARNYERFGLVSNARCVCWRWNIEGGRSDYAVGSIWSW